MLYRRDYGCPMRTHANPSHRDWPPEYSPGDIRICLHPCRQYCSESRPPRTFSFRLLKMPGPVSSARRHPNVPSRSEYSRSQFPDHYVLSDPHSDMQTAQQNSCYQRKHISDQGLEDKMLCQMVG